MKIVSRQAAPVHEPTPVQINGIRVDCDTRYTTVNSGPYTHNLAQRDFYIELTVRIPLTDEDTADGLKLNQRISNLRYAQLLEKK